jgi:hypothetical protein
MRVLTLILRMHPRAWVPASEATASQTSVPPARK